jgi:prevent-host-death family protein
MIATLRESKTRLSGLVNLASSGEEILITVHGQAKARILSVSEPRSDTADWLLKLSTLRFSLGQPSILVKKSTRRVVKFLGRRSAATHFYFAFGITIR